MTAAEPDDAPFAELLDDVLQQLLDGRQPDAAALHSKHPAAAHRLDEALAMAKDVAGRRTTVRPVLPGYEILRELGRGGMGTVYLARQHELDRTVALKVLPQTLGLAARSRQRFLAEARALARVEHENVVRIHRIVDDGELLAFEMEFVDGPSLQQLLDHLRRHRERTGSPPGPAQVAELLQSPALPGTRSLTQFFVQLALAVARALGALHAQGLVHRDVKPANVLLRRGGEPVLVDFGLVRGLPHDPSRTVGFVGTPVYSPPEQLRGDGPVGPTADVYGLAVTLYECLALSTPFAGRTTGEVLRRVESGAFAPLRRAAPGAPRDLETIVAHAMEADPRQRYADGTALADDLQRLLELQPIHARPVGPVRRFGKVLRRHRKMLLAAGTGALLVAASMWPLLDHVQAAHSRRERAQDHSRTAQLRLLSRDAQRRGDEALSQAQVEYERSLALDPADAETQRERDVVRLARWLQRLAVPEPQALPRALAGDEFRGLCAGLGPLTIETARRLAAGTEYGDAPANDLAAATVEDRSGVGLLAFLFGDFRLCENAWGSLRPDQYARPLVEAGLGLIELADGRPELAYVRLLQARRSFGAADTLALELADAALALGELALARHWLDGAPAGNARDNTRTRLELDLRLALGDDDGLADAYERLAHEDPGDPLPRHRLAQLAWRRGDLGEAASRLELLVQEWPRNARFRLDGARLALQRRRPAAYLQHVLAVVAQDFGRGSSRGSVADLLEILRLGGLHELHGQGVAATGAEHAGRTQFGGEMPLRDFLAPGLAAAIEQLVPHVATARREAAQLAAPDRLLGKTAEAAFVTTPLLLARLPGFACAITTRAALAAVPRLVVAASPTMLRFTRGTALRWFRGDWQPVELQLVTVPPDARPPAVFGSTLAAAGDRTGDGIDDVLVACGCVHPDEARGLVMLVDGRTLATIATLAGDSDRHMFGHALAVIGDVDGDGDRDWLIGAPSGDPEALRGRAEIWSSRTRERIAAIEGPGPGFGVSVAALDDVDGDGTRDFAVATPPLLRNSAAQGSVQILSGRSRQVLHTHTNDVPGIWYGACIQNAGDTDGDGRDDLVVGGNFGGAPGLVHLYAGRTAAKLQTWSDPDPEGGFGTLVLGTGDVDGDGCSDVAVSAVRDAASGTDHLFVFSGATGKRLARIALGPAGSASGSSVVAYRTPPHTLLLVGLPLGGPAQTGALEFWLPGGAKASTVLGPVPRAHFGGALTLVDDRDGDGMPEVVVGPGPAGGPVWVLPSRQIRFGG